MDQGLGYKDILNSRSIVVLLLGFSSGLPLVLVGSTLQAWYTSAGVDLMAIGALSLVGQPYIYKFLWAPLLDRFVPLPMGRRRSWILVMQIGLVLGFLWMAILNPAQSPGLLAIVALVVATCSASQDVAIDAYRTDLLPEKERGFGAGLTTVGWRFAALFGGALALVMADQIGWRNTYYIMAALMAVEMVVTFLAPQPRDERPAPSSLTKAVIEPLKEFISRRNALILILFIVIYKLADAFALTLNTTFLLRGVGFSLTDVGAITKVVGLGAALGGSVVGGVLLPRLGLYRSLFYFGILQAVTNLPFAILAVVGKNYSLMAASIFLENFCGSLSAVALIVLLMGLCNKRYTATQYALFSALASLGRVFVGPAAAWLVEQLDWAWFFVSTAVIGIPALMLLVWMRHRMGLFADDDEPMQVTPNLSRATA